MKYTLLLLLCVCLPGITQTLDFTYNTPVDWNYCVTNKSDCDKIAKAIEDDKIFPKFEIQPAVTNAQWATFATLQFLDIYTTYRGLKYECVRELNPLFGKNPSIEQMVITKGLVLVPAMREESIRGTLTKEAVNTTNLLMLMVVANNVDVLHRSQQDCNKIR